MTSPSSIPMKGDLQVGEDLPFQRREWSLQRASWVIAMVILVAALLGLLGDGLLSGRTVEEGGLQAHYGWIERHRAPTSLEVAIPTRYASEGKVELFVDRSWIEGLVVEGFTPEPESVDAAADHVVFSFAVEPGQAVVNLSFDVMHQGMGAQSGRIGVPGGPEVPIRQFILP